MTKMAIFLATGFEEIEAVSTIDVLRRGGMVLDLISVSGNLDVTGAHDITVKCDRLFYEVDYSEYEVLILPGGMPGTENLSKHESLMALLPAFYSSGKKLAAICAAPSILGDLGLLTGKEAIAYPGNEVHLKGAKVSENEVVTDGNIITAKGAGVAMAFGLEILKWYLEEDEVVALQKKLILT
ncbi:DJ-1 family glyoxalase III [Petrocella sp. FN5]|uniref:DJ-1 family glyoxalase III n=1 Tax=Petrocella sp. FN5 TaxID=3032002 RepID=UPI0023DBF7FD|nr:DJ-1 family glyoxalase III [Petrocella sp. FN5]MDF1617328.1 DJ-1/PfpI family protein [Petrocella sp. FN5]